MRVEEYLAAVTEQIRCKKARGTVAEELRQHMEDQKAAFLAEGMDARDAEAAAVREMGDPVETGVALDRIHRPKMAWGMILLIGVLSFAGFAAQYLLQRNFSEGDFMPENGARSLAYMLIGFGVMLGVCMIDYSRIAYRAKWISAVLFLGMLIGLKFFGAQVNGSRAWILLPGLSVNVPLASFLFVPLYGAILYSFRGQGYRAVGKGILWMLPVIIMVVLRPSPSVAFVLFFCFLLTLSAAVYKKWYRVSRMRTLGTLWGGVILLQAAMYVRLMRFGADYQKERLDMYLSGPGSNGYLFQKYKWIQAGEVVEDSGRYVLAYVISYYGILAGVLLSGLLAFLLLRLLHHSLRQKNQLGMLMGVGCSTVLIVQTVFYVLDNLGVIPLVGNYCPFLTYGGTGCIVTYTLLGILLSIYRYQNVLGTCPEIKTGHGFWKYRSE